MHPELIQDNKVHFQYDNKIYRVRMPNQIDIFTAEKMKNEYEVELLESKKVNSLKNLKKLKKESQGIDIDALEKELKDTENDIEKVYDSLFKRHDDDLDGIKADTAKYNEIKKKREELIREISKETSSAIEVQTENYFMAYLVSVCTERNENTETEVIWKNEWSSFDEYLKQPDSALKFYALVG